MEEITINEEAIDRILLELDNFVWTDKMEQEHEKLRQYFSENYDKKKIESLKKEDYFAGLGKKKGCIAYDLEWGTRKLGSIKGGSKYKYGYESDFNKIKSLLKRLIDLKVDDYGSNGELSNDLKDLIRLTKEINGFKTGRTVIPKLLSIYYPEIFLPFFNDQDHFIERLFVDEEINEYSGLELYLDYNYKLLKFKEKLEEAAGKEFNNYELSKLLYHVFPKDSEKGDTDFSGSEESKEEEKFEALEVQHYQSLLHRNFKRLFPSLSYFEEEEQIPKNGQYDTQTVGIMDMLCIDTKGNFTVIEIKRRATDKTIGQILRYMGWTKEELCKDGQKVTGIIVAERKDIQLEMAMKMIPNVKFMKLGLKITLEND